MANIVTFEVERSALDKTRVTEDALPSNLAESEVLLRIGEFAFTANNITYGATGEALQYWDFFPAGGPFGRIPVWGFADVVASRAEGLPEGERIFGYLPMATHLKVQAGRVTPEAFRDVSAHRANLPAAYQQYSRVAADRTYTEASADYFAILRPLFITSFLIDDFLDGNRFFDAKSVLVSSASSKTSIGLGAMLKKRAAHGITSIGLTSRKNIAFTKALGVYDEVIAYGDTGSLDAGVRTVYVDMAGNRELRAQVHNRFADNLAYSCAVGATHWEAMAPSAAQMAGPKAVFFFAPAQIKKRYVDWGQDGFDARFGEAWADFVRHASSWLRIETGRGLPAVESAYRSALTGESRPDIGVMLSLWES